MGIFRVSNDEAPGVDNCPKCGNRPFKNDHSMFSCCDSGWKDTFDWNLYVKSFATPEEDEEFERLNKPNIPIPDWPLREVGRNIERFGKLLQDPKTRLNELMWEAHKAGYKVSFKIQPKMEETTNEGLQA